VSPSICPDRTVRLVATAQVQVSDEREEGPGWRPAARPFGSGREASAWAGALVRVV